jgi:DNA-3-methyladenine glycosylase I
MKSLFGRDFSSIPDETAAGELYLDSFAVKNVFRKRGIGTLLLNATFEKAKKTGIAKVGLLVDVSNPAAEHLYDSVGFCDVDGSNWGGHAMKHLQKEV